MPTPTDVHLINKPLGNETFTRAAFNAIIDQLDGAIRGRNPMTTAQRDALTATQKWTGREIWNTTTGQPERWTGVAWTSDVTPVYALDTDVTAEAAARAAADTTHSGGIDGAAAHVQIVADGKTNAALITSYPEGHSRTWGDTANGWPAIGEVLTVRDGNRGFQIQIPDTGPARARMRVTNSGTVAWSNWSNEALLDQANTWSKGGQRIERDADVVGLAIRKFASGDTTAFLAFENEIGTTLATINNSGRFAAPAGAAGTPAFGFQAGAGDGIWRIGAGILGFAAGSAERLRLSATLAQFAAGAILTAENLKRGAGSPEGTVTGSIGDVYERNDGGTSTTFYVKESGNATNTGWVAHGRGSHSKYDEVHATSSVVNTVVQTDHYSKSIAGGDMPAGAMFRLVAWGDLINNSGGGIGYTYRVKLGATTVLATASFNVATSASRRKWTLEVWILGESTTAQRIGGRLTVSDIPGGAETMPQAQTLDFEGSNTSAEDTSTAKTLALTVQMAVAGATVDSRLLGAVLERVA